jgi:predicted TIM-barrel fold metal-dependent hydrolase
MANRTISADSHMLVLDEHVLPHLASEHHDAYLELGLELRNRIGVDNLLWATDYPHPDSTWPESQRVIDEEFTSCDQAEVRKLVCDNAARLYGL